MAVWIHIPAAGSPTQVSHSCHFDKGAFWQRYIIWWLSENPMNYSKPHNMRHHQYPKELP